MKGLKQSIKSLTTSEEDFFSLDLSIFMFLYLLSATAEDNISYTKHVWTMLNSNHLLAMLLTRI